MGSLRERLASLRPQDVGLAGPSTRDMARGFISIRADPLSFLVRMQTQYGDLVAFPVPGPPALLVNNPADVRHVLQTRARQWSKRTVQYTSLAKVTGPGLLASAEDSWLAHRRIAAPAFNHARLDHMGVQMRAAARRVSRSWHELPKSGAVINIDDLAMRITLDVVGRTLFSSDLSDATQQLVHATDEAAELVVAAARSVVPLPSWVPSPLSRRLRSAVQDLDLICNGLIAKRRQRGPTEQDDDLLGMLIAAGLDDRAVRNELVTMVVAGHETVASALTWTLMLLAEHPVAQDRLRTEVLSRDGQQVPMTRMAELLPWTRSVVDESLRLFPPAWVLSRRSTEPDVLSGQPLPAGTTAIISPWLLHRRPDAWPDPLTFRPERFLSGRGTTAHPDYIPFGLGPRLCIGRDFALIELVVVLSELLREHRVALTPGQQRPAIKAFAALRPSDGLSLHVSPAA